jgi:hypothetical protein
MSSTPGLLYRRNMATGQDKIFDLKKHRLGSYYEHKRVKVFFVVEGDVIVTVTVHVFYGEWEIDDGNSV